MAVRVAILPIAVLAVAWLALGLRGLGLSEDARRLATAPGATPAQIAEAERLLEDARFLNPDTDPLIMEGSMLAAQGGRRAREGVELLELAVRREPDNVVAWGVLANATRRLDPARSRAAQARERELSPPVERE